jgi:hypothetical protein
MTICGVLSVAFTAAHGGATLLQRNRSEGMANGDTAVMGEASPETDNSIWERRRRVAPPCAAENVAARTPLIVPYHTGGPT